MSSGKAIDMRLRKILTLASAAAFLALSVCYSGSAAWQEEGRGGGKKGPGGSRKKRPEPGSVIPPFVKDQLELTSEQEKQLAQLEKETKEKLKKILTAEQLKQMEALMRRGPGSPPGEDGPGGGKRRGMDEDDGPPDGGPPDRDSMEDGGSKRKGSRGRQGSSKSDREKSGKRPDRNQQSNNSARNRNGSKATEVASVSTGIQWYATLESGIAEAHRSNKPILFLSAAPSCAGVPGTW